MVKIAISADDLERFPVHFYYQIKSVGRISL
jgi:hypothetical protein